MKRQIKKLLVANRGEIALRVLRTAKELGIKTVAVYSDADANAFYIGKSDEAYNLGSALSAESYLRIDKIIAIAKKTRSDAIHPGYGFLAENADFASACEKNKIIFIGPSSKAIEKVGDKINAKKLAQKLGIPTLQATQVKGALKNLEYPIAIKASAGGGGKGMRIVRSAKDLVHAIAEAKSEAKSAFGDETVFIEKYLEKPHHIEVQILADKFGNVIHLGERECSIQRRHQKLVEETPSPFVDETLRHKLTQSAIRIAKASGYWNAGTVEFLVDQKRNFYFLEVNSRLQVEHPVTEMVTGLDLVREQIKIAQGKKLSFKQDDILFRGHAIECRICAEDPSSNFLPSSGDVLALRLPQGPFTRVDTALVKGDKITLYYDSLIAKLITFGENRSSAIARMKRALSEFIIVGVKTTIPFHIALFNNKKFCDGAIHTNFLEKDLDLKMLKTSPTQTAILLATALEHIRKKEYSIRSVSPKPLSFWRTAIYEGEYGRS